MGKCVHGTLEWLYQKENMRLPYITFDKIYPDSRIKLPKQAEWQFTAYQNRIEEFKNYQLNLV